MRREVGGTQNGRKMIRRSCVDCAVTACERRMASVGFLPDNIVEPGSFTGGACCYEDMEDQKLAIAAAEVEYEGYLKLTRVEEIIAFAGKSGRRKSESPPASD